MGERTVAEMEREIRAILPASAKLVEFFYDAQCFGNMGLRIEVTGKCHTFVTDRGEIHHNGVLVNNGAGDTLARLLLVIQRILNGR